MNYVVLWRVAVVVGEWMVMMTQLPVHDLHQDTFKNIRSTAAIFLLSSCLFLLFSFPQLYAVCGSWKIRECSLVRVAMCHSVQNVGKTNTGHVEGPAKDFFLFGERMVDGFIKNS